MAKRILRTLPPAKGAGRTPPGPRAKPRQKPAGSRWVITGTIRKEIRQRILGWSEPRITWEAILEKVHKRYETDCTRQALYNHKVLKLAFQATKKRLKEQAETVAPQTGKSKDRDYNVEALQDRIQYLEGQVAGLENTVEKYKAQFIRWQANAYMHSGMTFEQLDASIQGIDRGRSDK